MARILTPSDTDRKKATITRRDYVRSLPTSRRCLYWASWALPVIVVWFLFLSWFDTHYTIALNRSSSLEGSIYLIKNTGVVPERGALVAFRPGPTPVYTWSIIHVKRIGGVPGDTISLQDRTFMVNGVVKAVAKPVSRLGNPLTIGPTGVLPIDHYWVYTDSPDGYDSRYRDIGWITKDEIIGPAYVLL